ETNREDLFFSVRLCVFVSPVESEPFSPDVYRARERSRRWERSRSHTEQRSKRRRTEKIFSSLFVSVSLFLLWNQNRSLPMCIAPGSGADGGNGADLTQSSEANGDEQRRSFLLCSSLCLCFSCGIRTVLSRCVSRPGAEQ